MSDVKPSILQRLENALHSFADHHKPLIAEVVKHLRDLEKAAAEIEKGWEERFAKLAAEVSVLAGEVADLLAKDAEPVVPTPEPAPAPEPAPEPTPAPVPDPAPAPVDPAPAA